MPELPEVQAHAERLSESFGGAVLERFLPLSFTALKTADPPPAAAVGHALTRVGRRGKHLLLDVGDVTFVVHLMQGGRLRVDEKQARKPRGALARWVFEDGRALLLTEAGTEKRAGIWVVAGDPLAQEPLAALGPEADSLDRATLEQLLGAHRMRLHGFLRDQRVLAGIGRRLANEICFRARLSPFASTSKLSGTEVEQLQGAIGDAIDESLAFERGRTDMSSAKQRPGLVHAKVGEPCPECGASIRSVEYRAYTVAYCPTCQTAGRILADNTTSRFLK